MGSVYVASHAIGRRDAIKILHSEAARDPLIRERFRREAEAVNRFVHPGVVEIRDIDETEDGCPFLVMELLDGQSLSERVRRHGYPPLPEVLHISTTLLDVLAAAHAQGIVHRDVKPANVFLLRDGRVKVLDFGVAQVRSGQQLTQLGTRLGTVAYMPPEQVRGQPIDARADLFAVGATMFRMIGQRRVHEAETDEELVVKMATLPAPPLATVAPGTPEPVCRVVDRALQFQADARYPDAATMRGDVCAVAAGHPPPFASRVAPVATGGPPAGRAVVHADHVAGPAAPVQAPPPAAAAAAWAGTSAAPLPGRAPWVGEASSVLTQATAWTTLTPQQRRTHWALLAFPVLGLVMVALVFQWVVHRGIDDDAQHSEGEGEGAVADARPAGPEPATAAASTAAWSGARPPVAPAGPGAAGNCVEAGRCEARCKGPDCTLDCHSGTCEVGLVDGSKLACKGEGLCEPWCAGECEVACKDAPCRVHCTPGKRCRIEKCQGARRQCAGDVQTCNVPCE